MTLDDLERKIGGFYGIFGHFRLWESISFTRRRCQRHMHLWPMRIMVPMGQVQVICDFQNYITT